MRPAIFLVARAACRSTPPNPSLQLDEFVEGAGPPSGVESLFSDSDSWKPVELRIGV